MGIKVEEDLLFEKLRISLPEAVCDGVVDEKNFFSARYRIVYILKEVNGGESWDLRKFLYDGGRPQTWDNIARWSKGIFSWEKEFYWEELQENNEKRRREQLKKIADGLEISVIEFLDIEIENEADLIAVLKKISPFFKWEAFAGLFGRE